MRLLRTSARGQADKTCLYTLDGEKERREHETYDNSSSFIKGVKRGGEPNYEKGLGIEREELEKIQKIGGEGEVNCALKGRELSGPHSPFTSQGGGKEGCGKGRTEVGSIPGIRTSSLKIILCTGGENVAALNWFIQKLEESEIGGLLKQDRRRKQSHLQSRDWLTGQKRRC